MIRFLRSSLCVIGSVSAILALSACGSDQDPTFDIKASTTTKPADGVSTSTTLDPNLKVFIITVTGNKVDGGVQESEVQLGDKVRFEITSDTTNEVHVHGYDLTGKLEAGAKTFVEFITDKPGIWEIELHEGKVPLAMLKVTG